MELARIIDTPHRARRAAMIMAYSGLRRGELIPLTYNDIDLNAHTIRVNKSVAMVNGKPVVKSYTKTEAGMRVVTIPQLLVDFLNQDFNGEYAPNDLVCPGKANCLMTESAFDRMWESYLVDLNLKYGDFSDLKYRPKSKFDPRGVPMQITPFTPHCLRHTFASLLYKAGVDVLTAKDQLGHEDVKTTLQIYTHLDKIYKEKRMNKLDDYLKDASQMQVR